MGGTSCHRSPTPPASATTLAHKHELWWSPRDPEQQPLWNSVVVLSADFYDEFVAHAVPIDLRALRALRGSPLALDIYSWLTYRMSYLRKPCLIPMKSVMPVSRDPATGFAPCQ